MLDIVNHLHAEGYPVSEFTPDGKIHRFEIEKGDRRAGFYVAHRNYLIRTGEEYFYVQYGSWRSGEIKNFTTLKGILTPDDKKNLEKQIQKDKKLFETEKKKEQEEAAREAEEKWKTLQTTGTSDYLIRKQIADCPLDIRFDNFNGDAYVPIKDHSGKLWSLQKLPRHGGFKPFYPGSRITDNYFTIGNIDPTGKIFLTEGVATAGSIFLATENPTVCAFSAGNLSCVALQLRKFYPNARIILCGDEDKLVERSDGTTVNPGRVAAEKAALASNAIAIFPKGIKGTDFNDVHVELGLEELRSQIEEQLKEKETAIIPAGIHLTYEALHTPFPDENEKFVRLDTHYNVAELLKRMGVIARYNVISKKEELLLPGLAFSIDNMANATYGHIITACKKARIPTDNLQSHLTIISDWHQYNPVVKWIESVPWDGKSRLQALCDTIKAKNDPLKEILMKRWLISAVAAAYEPNGISAHGILVLQGNQYLGKTMWFKKLVPQELNVIADGKSLKIEDKDSIMQIISKWLVELGEINSTFKRSDIEQLKSFLTRQTDEVRNPYARKNSTYARRTIFFGSVNEEDYLRDPTGNRRFWTIACTGIDHGHQIDMQQLWAEVREIYATGEKWVLTNEENDMLNQYNENFQFVESIEQKILEYFEWERPAGDQWVELTLSATQICEEMGIVRPLPNEVKVAGRVARKNTKFRSVTHKGIQKYRLYARSKVRV